MTIGLFLQHNIALVILFIALFIAVATIEYLDNGRGVRKLSTFEATRFFNDKKALAFDLRSDAEFKAGHIKQAKHLLAADLLDTPKKWLKKMDSAVLLIDEHGSEAASTAVQLKKQGYTAISVLGGGLAAWRKENLPLSNTEKRDA